MAITTQGTTDHVWKNKSYEEMAKNLPQFQYTRGWIDDIGDTFGFRTGQDKARDEFTNYRNNLLAQLIQLDEETEYNNAINQVERQAAAGINSDLAGGISPGEAGEVDNQAANAPETPEGVDLETIGKAANEVTKFVGFIATGVSTCLAAAQTMGAIELNDINVRNGIYEEVGKLIEGHWRYDENTGEVYLSSPYYNEDRNDVNEGSGNGDNVLDEVVSGAISWNTFKNNRRNRERWKSKRQLKYAYRAFNDILKNLNIKTKGVEAITNSRTATQRLGESLEDTRGNDITSARNFYKDVKPYLLEIEKLSAKIDADFNKKMNELSGGKWKAKSQVEQWKYNTEYYNKLEPDWAASFENNYNQKMGNYYEEWMGKKAAQAENDRNEAYIENIGVVMELNRTYNKMIMEELKNVNSTKDPMEKALHIMFLQTLTSGKAGNQSVLEGAGKVGGIISKF